MSMSQQIRDLWADEPAVEYPCPDWCTLEPGHRWDSESSTGTAVRSHGGPDFGPIGIAGEERADRPGEIRLLATTFSGDLDAAELNIEDLINLSVQARLAAAWLEVHGGLGGEIRAQVVAHAEAEIDRLLSAADDESGQTSR